MLIDENHDAVLCDFGLATFIQYSGAASGLTTSRSTKGSTRYMSPELFQDSEAKHTLESDIWGWACTVFEVPQILSGLFNPALTRELLNTDNHRQYSVRKCP